MRVGILGGSFDPVHHGHLIAAQVLREQLHLDAVRLVPAAQQPLKPAGHGASARDRAAMVGLAAQGEPGLQLEPIEVDRGGSSWTVDTLRALRDREPAVQWVLLVGTDAAADLARWREVEALRGLAELVTFSRGGVPTGDHGVATPNIAISSTAVRTRVRDGLSIRYWVPDTVADYVATHRLYQDGNS
ncbi:MAG: nicotinate-nucleotide adenylyltransferase [Gemmatimonadota bacterium]|nr:nicotinate-nucleotide adenylyltransferase [Gemmatimonadota bacterium]